MAKVIITSEEHKVAMLLDQSRRSLEMPDLNPVEILFNFQELLQEYAFCLEALQYGGVGKERRDEEEDAEEVLAELRKDFTSEALGKHILHYENLLSAAKLLDNLRFVCNHTKTATV
ncbi:MAG: hypothetical protein IKC07_02870 [Clostridia bacterium]|nr:hypothetical protein [Clostridia bacterium]